MTVGANWIWSLSVNTDVDKFDGTLPGKKRTPNYLRNNLKLTKGDDIPCCSLHV